MKLYEPTHVLKPLGEDLWLVDGSVAWMKLGIGLRIPFTTRMAVVRLPDGEILQRLIAWEPERVLIAHGRCYEREGALELRRAFRWLDPG